MRHRNSGRKLGRKASHRDALWSNLVTSLFLHGRIETTEAKAKELRKHADSTIGWGISVHDLVAKGEKMTAQEKVKVVHAKRMARWLRRQNTATLERFAKPLLSFQRFNTMPGDFAVADAAKLVADGHDLRVHARMLPPWRRGRTVTVRPTARSTSLASRG